MLTGPTACPIYINPLEPTPLECPPSVQQFGPKSIVAPVKPPKTITPIPIEKGPPVHLQPEFNQRPVSPMVFALTTAPAQPYSLRASPLTVNNQKKSGTSIKGQAPNLPNFQPSFDAAPQPFQHQHVQFKPMQPVQAPHPVAIAPRPAPAPQLPPPPPMVQAPPPPPVVQAPPPPMMQPLPPAPKPVYAPPPPPQQQAQIVAPRPQMPMDLGRLAPAVTPARPISPLPSLTQIPAKQTFPPPAPVSFQRPTSPLPALTTIPAKQTFPPPAPMFNLSKTLSSAVAAAAAPPPVFDPAPSGFGMAPSPASNAGGAAPPKGGSTAGTSAPRRGRGILTAPVTGGRAALCGHCNGQIRSAA